MAVTKPKRTTTKKNQKKAPQGPINLSADAGNLVVNGDLKVTGKVTYDLVLQVKKLRSDAKLPTKETRDVEDAGWDFYTNERKRIAGHSKYTISTGLAIAIPAGWVGRFDNRSGGASNSPLMIDGGVIDPGYRGEVKIVLVNTSDFPYDIEKGQKIAQMLFSPIPKVEIVEVTELSSTDRGEAGFGSSGK